MTSSSSIFIDNMRLRAFHGVMEQERQIGAMFSVTLTVGYDISRAMATDDIADAISYATVADIVRHEMSIPSRLLEHVAGRTAKAILHAFPQATWVSISLTKHCPPMQADCDGAGVRLTLSRDDTE